MGGAGEWYALREPMSAATHFAAFLWAVFILLVLVVASVIINFVRSGGRSV